MFLCRVKICSIILVSIALDISIRERIPLVVYPSSVTRSFLTLRFELDILS